MAISADSNFFQFLGWDSFIWSPEQLVFSPGKSSLFLSKITIFESWEERVLLIHQINNLGSKMTKQNFWKFSWKKSLSHTCQVHTLIFLLHLIRGKHMQTTCQTIHNYTLIILKTLGSVSIIPIWVKYENLDVGQL